MASELKVDKFTGVTTAGSILVTGEGNSTTTNLQQGLCKVWFCFDGTSTVSLLDSFNTTSITDEATGKYTFAIANDFSNVNYSAVGMPSTNTGDGAAQSLHRADDSNVATGTIRIESTYATASTNALVDRDMHNVAIFGDLA